MRALSVELWPLKGHHMRGACPIGVRLNYTKHATRMLEQMQTISTQVITGFYVYIRMYGAVVN